MRRLVMAACPVLVLSLAGCGEDNNPPAEVATLSQEQIKAEEKYYQKVSDTEMQNEKSLEKAVYVPREQAVVEEAERSREAALRDAGRNRTPSSRRR